MTQPSTQPERITAMKVSEKLAQELHAIGEFEMETKAREGYYGDFTSPLATPIMQLVNDLQAKGHTNLARRAMNGVFDGE